MTTFKKPTKSERIHALLRLVDALEKRDDYRIGAEVLRLARFLPGWSLKRGTPGLFEVDSPGRPGLHLNRDDTLALLRSRWLPEAITALHLTPTPEPGVVDEATETRTPPLLLILPFDVAIREVDGWIDIDVNGGDLLRCSRDDVVELRDALDAFLQQKPVST